MTGVDVLTNRIANMINGYRNDMGALRDLQWNLDILHEEGPKYKDVYNNILGQIYDMVEEGILDAEDLYDILEAEQ